MVEDRRVRKTKNAIKQAFIKLLAEKELERITIQDITTLADVNRGTFYLHYEDKYILLSDLEDEILASLADEIGTSKLVMQDSNLEDFAKNFSKKILKISFFIYKKISIFT